MSTLAQLAEITAQFGRYPGTAPETPAITAPSQAEPTKTPFEDRACILVKLGIPVAPVQPREKACKLPGWETLATTDLGRIKQWSRENPDFNTAAVARAEIGGFCFFEVDAPNFHLEIEKQTGQKFPETFMVSSTPGKGKGHFYFRSTPASIAFYNSVQKSYVSGKDENGRENYSFRINNAYVVGPDSVKQDGTVYTVVKDIPVADCPDWLVDYCSQSKTEDRKPETAPQETVKVHEGGRNSYLASRLGKVHQSGVKMPELLTVALQLNEQHCVPALEEKEVRVICESIAKYPVKESGQMIFDTPAHSPAQPEIVVPKLNKVPFPAFPEWTMQSTSIYEGFVKPVCAVNSRIPYFMFLPAAAIMMNYLGNKVRVEHRNQIPSFFMVLIGEKGRAIKSSSVEDAIEYLNVAGFVRHASGEIRNAEGKSLVWTVGSPEGLGLEMERTHCRNATLFYDELSTLTSKTEIDSSSLKSSLLTLYESGKFSNTIKSRREAFSIDPRTYCASLIACSTNENFEDNWSRLCGKSSGLDDRFIFLLQPQQLPELTPKIDVNTVAGAMETKKRIDKAVQQQVYRFEDTTDLENKIGELGNRTEIRAEKWALYFAIDLGLDSITESCVERGLAVANYEKAVKKYLGSPEAETRIAAAQIKYRRLLERKFDGRAKTRDMERAMNSNRYGTEGWYRIYDGLKKAGIIAEIGGNMPGTIKEVVIREPLDE